MKTYQSLYIYLKKIDTERFIEEILNQNNPYWIGETKNDLAIMVEDFIRFESTNENKNLSDLSLVLFQETEEKYNFYVPTIVPTEKNKNGRLTPEKYNQALNNFYKTVLSSFIEKGEIEVELTSDSITVESVAGKQVADALIAFSGAANKSTGNSHPCDERRWFKFITLAHKSNAKIDFDLIVGSLKELGWTEKQAHELACEFENAISLLSYYDEF